LKVGAEYIWQRQSILNCDFCMGDIDVTGGNPPANVEQLFPVWNDVSTWNLAALSPITRAYKIGVGQLVAEPLRHVFASWVQDDWALSNRFTLNLGLRYDLGVSPDILNLSYAPWLGPGRHGDKNDFGPRVGFAYSLTNRTVLRGGYGLYFANEDDNDVFWTMIGAHNTQIQVLNDGRPDFTANPFNGPIPTYDQALELWRQGKYVRYARQLVPEHIVTPYSNQASVGVQKQFGTAMALEADYIYNQRRADGTNQDINLAYNPLTGVNYPFSDRTRKPNAGWDDVNVSLPYGASNYHALQMSFNKRMSDRWQAAATYLLAGQWNEQHAPINPGCTYPVTTPSPGVFVCDVPITLHPVIAEEWYLSSEQRQRVTLNGIWDAGFGLQLSGVYLYGDNGWATPTSGVDALQTGTTAGGRVRANGTIILRNAFDRSDIHKVDLRIQRRFRFGRASVDGIAEVFNLFNHANYGSFVTNESNVRYGLPQADTNIAYAARTLQLGFRATF